jgi:hypothetical protein
MTTTPTVLKKSCSFFLSFFFSRRYPGCFLLFDFCLWWLCEDVASCTEKEKKNIKNTSKNTYEYEYMEIIPTTTGSSEKNQSV